MTAPWPHNQQQFLCFYFCGFGIPACSCMQGADDVVCEGFCSTRKMFKQLSLFFF